MKKIATAILAGTLLVAGQAFATTESTVRVGDRVGAASAESSEFAGGISAGLIFAAATVAGFALIASINDDSESD
ncbi:hypothetical protein [uncultured Brevundimonas sp.]|uniref:hypothetical protein n=1 Tax=uncultured Brevundimonas sp. TaxID=213418 RepID=UPI00262B4501|nr:hypothetical protein [uncultured Brevundimonas sp.]